LKPFDEVPFLFDILNVDATRPRSGTQSRIHWMRVNEDILMSGVDIGVPWLLELYDEVTFLQVVAILKAALWVGFTG